MNIDIQTDSPSSEESNDASTEDRLARKLGLTPENIEKAKLVRTSVHFSKQGHRQEHINAVCEFAPEFQVEFGEGTLLAAATVLAGLVKRGRGKTSNGKTIRGPNCIGDALGGHGLNLPRIVKDGKMRYAIAFFDSTEDEKAEAQERLNNLSKQEMLALPVA